MRDFLEVNSPDAAERAISTLFAALQRLEDFPNLDRPTGDDSIRQRVVPFGSACYVLRVWHGREART
ncbi:type II toxin-antitoxin system RelE/ParE family toxin [Rhodopseudomonas palustris]|uniref:type II toxin-antitoxin system RelE/ParE family toxin n=1 Tax=Rhodopseudomonas palustris TaxID=1076 RepID=UPI000E5C18BD|nr:type II toxin-antitoxin system RelE/ParE family toxin [Rhodopseudomonas palustris]QLH71761.1 type II toxin-antitoxin system RelE/ParE family toxin [Rhodopseudomonas palustris]RIA02989.1 type II toxin-antitoxin system RelE/ParE family toxin [Rhodopseudomonas palustris]